MHVHCSAAIVAVAVWHLGRFDRCTPGDIFEIAHESAVKLCLLGTSIHRVPSGGEEGRGLVTSIDDTARFRDSCEVHELARF